MYASAGVGEHCLSRVCMKPITCAALRRERRDRDRNGPGVATRREPGPERVLVVQLCGVDERHVDVADATPASQVSRNCTLAIPRQPGSRNCHGNGARA